MISRRHRNQVWKTREREKEMKSIFTPQIALLLLIVLAPALILEPHKRNSLLEHRKMSQKIPIREEMWIILVVCIGSVLRTMHLQWDTITLDSKQPTIEYHG